MKTCIAATGGALVLINDELKENRMDLKAARATLLEEWHGIKGTTARVLFAIGCGVVVLGVVAALYLLVLFSQSTVFSSGELSVSEFLMAVAAGVGMSSYGLLLVVVARMSHAVDALTASRPDPSDGE